MGIYSGAEIFQIAMELEDAGRVFYETLAEKSKDEELSDLCWLLSEQETVHYRMFKKMSDELAQRPASRPPTWDEMHFAHILIEERVLSDSQTAEDAARSGDVVGILDTAIQLEKDSILFYNELLGEVDEKDIPAVKEVIDEEKHHYRNLVEAKRAFKR